MGGVDALWVGWRTVAARPKFVLGAWMLHAAIAAAASLPAWRLFAASIGHRPVFSGELLHDFSLDLLIDWRGAFGQPLRGLLMLAIVLAAVYAAAKILFDCFLYPAYLFPFDDFRDGRLGRAALQAAPGVIAASIAGVGLSLVIGGFILKARQHPGLMAAAFLTAVFLRVLLNLWKCSGLGDALSVLRARFGVSLWLTIASAGSIILYSVAAAAWAWIAVGSAHPAWMFALQQGLIALSVLLRLWLTASAVVLFRSVMMSLGHA